MVRSSSPSSIGLRASIACSCAVCRKVTVSAAEGPSRAAASWLTWLRTGTIPNGCVCVTTVECATSSSRGTSLRSSASFSSMTPVGSTPRTCERKVRARARGSSVFPSARARARVGAAAARLEPAQRVLAARRQRVEEGRPERVGLRVERARHVEQVDLARRREVASARVDERRRHARDDAPGRDRARRVQPPHAVRARAVLDGVGHEAAVREDPRAKGREPLASLVVARLDAHAARPQPRRVRTRGVGAVILFTNARGAEQQPQELSAGGHWGQLDRLAATIPGHNMPTSLLLSSSQHADIPPFVFAGQLARIRDHDSSSIWLLPVPLAPSQDHKESAWDGGVPQASPARHSIRTSGSCESKATAESVVLSRGVMSDLVYKSDNRTKFRRDPRY